MGAPARPGGDRRHPLPRAAPGSSATFVRVDQWLGAPRNRRALHSGPPVRGGVRPGHRIAFRGGSTSTRTGPSGLSHAGAGSSPSRSRASRRTCRPARDGDRSAARSIGLVPEYDCYVMGFRNVTSWFRRRRAWAAGTAWPFPVAPVPWLLVDGAVAGTWTRARRRGRRRRGGPTGAATPDHGGRGGARAAAGGPVPRVLTGDRYGRYVRERLRQRGAEVLSDVRRLKLRELTAERDRLAVGADHHAPHVLNHDSRTRFCRMVRDR